MQIIKDWETKISNHIFTIDTFFAENNRLHKDYTDRNKNRSEIGFNVFTLSSNFYYRENFHSDIIKSFLNPFEKHNEGNKYLQIFIELLNKVNNVNNQNEIKKDDFKNSIVEREKHFIINGKSRYVDILITNENSRKAIIIENKINNAVDQEKQLPDYVNSLKNNKYKVVAVVYLTLNSSKRPDKNDWNDNELREVNSILKLIPAYDIDASKTNLFNNWIVPSIISSQNIDSSFLLRQYGELIKYLNTNTMDTISLEKFYDSLKEKNSIKTAISIRNMLNDLPEYLAIRIEEKYKEKCYPFSNIYRWKQRDTVFNAFEIDNLLLKLDVWCDIDGYSVHFWETKDSNFDISTEFKDKLEILSDFNVYNNEKNNLKKRFEIFEEDKLFEFIDKLLFELKSIKETRE